jgi:predicted lysophospholipase L1 biosynthesis ABC-type transport system permease subunit
MSGQLLAFIIADIVGAATLWKVTRSGRRYPWAWSLAAWVVVAAIGIGLIPFNTIVQVAALTLVIGVGMLTPIVGIVAALVLFASPVVVARQLWGWWRRRVAISRA